MFLGFSIANQYHVERLLVGSQRSIQEALEKINADFVIDGLQSPTSSTRLIESSDDDVETGVKINGRFGNLPLSMLMSSGILWMAGILLHLVGSEPVGN